jgi:hypothetical protein
VNTGSRDEQRMLANIGRAAKALERIADSLEQRDPVPDIADWLRGDQGEQIRIGALHAGIPVEDAIATAIERRYGR